MTEYLPDDNKAYKDKEYWDVRFGRCVLPLPCRTNVSRLTGVAKQRGIVRLARSL